MMHVERNSSSKGMFDDELEEEDSSNSNISSGGGNGSDGDIIVPQKVVRKYQQELDVMMSDPVRHSEIAQSEALEKLATAQFYFGSFTPIQARTPFCRLVVLFICLLRLFFYNTHPQVDFLRMVASFPHVRTDRQFVLTSLL